MSMQEVREQNIALVTQTALACFVENGIEKTTIRDIAQHAGLTERSVYRYFAGKDELVIAAAYLYWDRAKELAAQSLAKQRRRGMTGIEEIRVLLRSYAGLIFTDPAGIRFSLDAEVALCNANILLHPLPTLLSLSRIEFSKGEFYVYNEAYTPSVERAIEALDDEIRAILRKVGFPAPSCKALFEKRYGGPWDEMRAWFRRIGSRQA